MQALTVFYLHEVVEVHLLSLQVQFFLLPPAFFEPGLADGDVVVDLFSGRVNQRLGLDDLVHSLLVLHDDELVDCRYCLVESSDVALIVEVHIH
jgi:hypothetical protein